MSSRSLDSMAVADAPGIGGDVVQVEFECVRPGILEASSKADPAAQGAPVQAGDDGDRDRGLDPLERGHVAIRGTGERLDGGEVVEGLGEDPSALLERAREADLLGEDLLLEQRRQDDRADPCTFQPPGRSGGRCYAVPQRRRSGSGARDRGSGCPSRSSFLISVA